MDMFVTTTFTIEGYRIRRYDASEVVSKGSATEVLCYGTAVIVEPEK